MAAVDGGYTGLPEDEPPRRPIGPQPGVFPLPIGHVSYPRFGDIEPAGVARIMEHYEANGGRERGDWESNDVSKAESRTSRKPVAKHSIAGVQPVAATTLCSIDPTFSGELPRFHIGHEMSWWAVDRAGRLAPCVLNRRSESTQPRHAALLMRLPKGRGRVGMRFTSDNATVRSTDRLYPLEVGRSMLIWNVIYGLFEFGDDPAAICQFECEGDDEDFEDGCLALLLAVFITRTAYPSSIPCGKVSTLAGGFATRHDIVARLPRRKVKAAAGAAARTAGDTPADWAIPPTSAHDVIEFLVANEQCFDPEVTIWLQITFNTSTNVVAKKGTPRAVLRLQGGSGWQTMAWGVAQPGDLVLTVVQRKDTGAWDQLHVIRRAVKRTAEVVGGGDGGGKDGAASDESGGSDDDGSLSGDRRPPPPSRRRNAPSGHANAHAGASGVAASAAEVRALEAAAAASAAAGAAAASTADAAASAARSAQSMGDATIARLEAELATWRSRADGLTSTNARLTAELATAKAEASRVSSVEDEVQQLRQQLADAKNTIGQMRGAGRALAAERTENLATIARLEQTIQDLRAEAREDRHRGEDRADARAQQEKQHAMMGAQLSGTIALTLAGREVPSALLPAPQPVAFPTPTIVSAPPPVPASAPVLPPPQTGVPSTTTKATVAPVSGAAIDTLFT